MEKNMRKDVYVYIYLYIFIYVTESLRCTPETNNIVNQLYVEVVLVA